MVTYPEITGEGMVRHLATQLTDRSYVVGLARSVRGLRLPAPRRCRGETGTGVWAVSMVRNEQDVVEGTIQHLLSQDVDRVIVVDNGSTDSTPRILRRLAAQDERLVVGVDREPAYYQSQKMTLLALHATRAGARWIVPFDADEWWFAEEGTIGRFLATCGANVVEARLHNAFPTLGETVRLEVQPHEMRKVAYRANPLAVLAMGNHWVSRSGPWGGGLRIAHFPWRSQDQLVSKLRQGAAAFEGVTAGANVGRHWREAGAAGDDTLRQKWQDVVAGRPSPGLGWSPRGPFVDADPRGWKTWGLDRLIA